MLLRLAHYESKQTSNMKHSIAVVIVLLAHTEVYGQTCDGNIAQALQKCASSIMAGDSLPMQQEKCGCNYDYPVTNDIDNLNQQYEDLSSMMQQLQAQLSDSMAEISKVKAGQGAANATIQGLVAAQDDTSSTIQSILATQDDTSNTIQNILTDQDLLKASVANNSADIEGIIEHIEHPCGSSGWTRIAYLDMSRPDATCPTEFMLYNASGKLACGRLTSSISSCNSIIFPIPQDLSYSSVCGKVLGYQKGTPQAINTGVGHSDINSYYVDGVSITYGEPPNRQHIWTFMASVREDGKGDWTCPCYIGSTIENVQAFIGDDYFCEAGNPVGFPAPSQLYTDDPLWDGETCGYKESPCCQIPGLPWFTKTLSSTTTESVELRICGDEGTANEDNPIFFYEIYVK